MLRFIVFVALSTAVFGRTLYFDAEWTRFKIDYKREYENGEEEVRREIFRVNLEYINKHNSEGHTYTLGVNQFTDKTNEEFRAMVNGYDMNQEKPKSKVFGEPKTVEDLPPEVDWRTKGYVTPIKNQGNCGSCWAFSATGSLEGQHFKKAGKLVSLSEQNLVDCSRKEGNYGCEGGLMDLAFEYIKENKGIDTEASYPYKAMDEKCHFKRENVGATDNGFVDIQNGSESALQQAVATVGPISVAIDASHPSFQFYKSGIYVEPKCSSARLDHGVLAIGYGTTEGQDYWLVKNSWGTHWGMKGYIKMARNHRNMCGIATAASYPTV